MDMPPPQKSPVEQVKILDYDLYDYDYHRYMYFLDEIDSAKIPVEVKELARKKDCRYLREQFFLSSEIYKDEKDVYFCKINGKNKYILNNGKNYHFATPYEKIRYYKNLSQYYFM